MSGMASFAAMFCAAMSAVNIWAYAATGAALNLGAAVFCGLLVIVNLAMGMDR